MKLSIAIWLLASLPGLVLASGDHAGHDHGSKSQAKPGVSMEAEAHDATAGKAGDPAKVNRVVEISMGDDMRFVPDTIQVKAGETIRFLIRNHGALTHEMVIGSLAELKEHADMMLKMPDMKHAEPNMISLAAKQTGGLIWQFEKAGKVDFACLVPGQMEAGMVGKVDVQ